MIVPFIERIHFRWTAVLTVVVAGMLSGESVFAQQTDLSSELSALQQQVARLQAALSDQVQVKKPQVSGSDPSAAVSETQAGSQNQTPGVPQGMQIKASYQNCLQCHQKRPTGPLPPSHLEHLEPVPSASAGSGTQTQSAAAGQNSMQGMGMKGGDKGMGMMKGKGMGKMGGGMGNKGMGMGKKSMGGMGMGGGMGMKGMGMGGSMGMSKKGKGMGMGGMQGMGGQSSGTGGMDQQAAGSQPALGQRMQRLESQVAQLQQQIQQLTQLQMQLVMMQLKMMDLD